jgi:hypothetical protein
MVAPKKLVLINVKRAIVIRSERKHTSNSPSALTSVTVEIVVTSDSVRDAESCAKKIMPEVRSEYGGETEIVLRNPTIVSWALREKMPSRT